MIHANIITGQGVQADERASLNNVKLGDGVAIGQRSTLFGSPRWPLEVGAGTRIGKHSILNGFAAPLRIGERCSIGHFCHIIVDTGPTASPPMLRLFPIREQAITIGSDCWIGSGTMVIAGVTIGEGVVVQPKSFVNSDLPPNCVAGGCPARILGRTIPEED